MTDTPNSKKPPSPIGDTAANALWGGRFAAGPSAIMERINASIGFDRRLAEQDIAGSQAHAAMLAEQGIISRADADLILDGLQRISEEIASGSFRFKTELEDIHMNVEARLAELIGPAAGRLPTARSTDSAWLRCWVPTCSLAYRAVAPLPTSAGVLGIVRTIAAS